MAAVGAEPDELPSLCFCVFEELFVAPATPGEEMKPDLWSWLPEEVLEKVLLLLPASSQARFRAVCKEWLNLLVSKPFRTRTAALAFSRNQFICGVSDNRHDDASELSSPRYKVHKVGLEFLPSQFQARATPSFCQQGLMVLSSFKKLSYSACVVNPLNQTYRVLPRLGRGWGDVSGFSVEESPEGDYSFRAYTDAVFGYDDEVLEEEKYGAVYRSDSHAWRWIPRAFKEYGKYCRDIAMLEGAMYFAEGWSKIDIDVYCQKNGNLLHSFPPWQQQAVAYVRFLVEGKQVVALAFSTTAENVCEVWKVDSGSTAWAKLAAMPHGVLWPLDDVLFFSVRKVEVVRNIAFISVLGHDKPVHNWKECFSWARDCSSHYPEFGFLVAFDLVQASWKVVCDRWPYIWRNVIQPNPAIDVSWVGEPSASG